MKKKLLLAAFSLLLLTAFSQAPMQLNYQAVVRDNTGQPVANNTSVALTFNILAGSTSGGNVYTETITTTTNQFGLATAQIGSTADLSTVNWNTTGGLFLNVRAAIAGGAITDMGTTQLVSVPYAIYAGSNWGLSGNSIDTGNFIGTTNNNPLNFKVNNENAGYIDNTNEGNTSFGYESLFSRGNGGDYNTAFGSTALHSNTGADNTATGYGAMYNNTTGAENTANGVASLSANTTGSNNTAIGVRALVVNTTGSYNTAAGSLTLYRNTTGVENTAAGYQALYGNTIGDQNTADGYLALDSNTTGSGNIAIGAYALELNTTGGGNTATGYAALINNKTGESNTANGYAALDGNTTGINNTAIGNGALLSNTTGSLNVAVGTRALYNNNQGFNTACGDSALYSTTASQYNVAVGYHAGFQYNNGYNNVFLGANTDVNGTGYYNVIAIGQGTTITASDQVRIGNSATTSIGGYEGWTNISDGRFKKNLKEDVKGLDFIMKLRPVTYNLKVSELNAKLNENRGKEMSEQMKAAIAEKENMVQSGFVAQEVEQAAKDAGYDFSGVDKPKNENDVYGLRYAEFVVPLVKAVQELNAKQDASVTQIQEMQKVIDKLQQQIQQLKGNN